MMIKEVGGCLTPVMEGRTLEDGWEQIKMMII